MSDPDGGAKRRKKRWRLGDGLFIYPPQADLVQLSIIAHDGQV